MVVREREILLEEKLFVENFLDALKKSDITYFFNSLCWESQGFLKGIAAATGKEELYIVESCMNEIRERCECILDYDNEIQSVGMAKNCMFVRIQDILIYLVVENGEFRVDYLRDWEDDFESNINFH